jgi:hypothetical protein
MQKNSRLVIELVWDLWASTHTWQGLGKYDTNQTKHNNNNAKGAWLVVQEKQQMLASKCLKCYRSNMKGVAAWKE